MSYKEVNMSEDSFANIGDKAKVITEGHSQQKQLHRKEVASLAQLHAKLCIPPRV